MHIIKYKISTGKGGYIMLKDHVKAEIPEKEELKVKLKAEREKLAASLMSIKDAKLPVMVICEGFGGAGVGSTLGKVVNCIDPRFFKLKSFGGIASEDEKRYPFLYRYMLTIPEAGKFTFYDGFWMHEITDALLDGSLSEKLYEKRVSSIQSAERALHDNGYIILKFFFRIGKKEQKKRFEKLLDNKDTKWRVDDGDLRENKEYEDHERVYDRYLNDTDSAIAPWYIVDSEDERFSEWQLLSVINRGIDTALKNKALAAPVRQNRFKLVPMQKLSEVSFEGKELTDEEYEEELKDLQKRLRALHYRLYRKKIPVVIAYEGWDAAGKGGNIKRITKALDPRGYEVHPVASPEPHEKARFFLWRFWNRLPKTGHIAIFDRTWYGRVMVERLEGFCSENDWQRAYNEMNEFEKELSDWGAVVIKFWVDIDKDTQLARFTDRQNTPEKQWKITDEDWRNREKWDLYEAAVDEMLEKTSTEFAPWYILESVDKKYARIKALRIVIKRLEEACGKD